MKRLIGLLVLLVLLAGCEGRGQDISQLPTRIVSLPDFATAEFQTENAPPPGYRQMVNFPQVDANLGELPNWRYEMVLEFNGVFSGTPREARASTEMIVRYNQIDNSRRVILSASGVVLGNEADEPIEREGVRLGPDTFLVVDNVCQGRTDESELLADLGAGEIIGGVTQAQSTSINAVIHGERVWRYDFTVADLNLPAVRFNEDSVVRELRGEFWVAPERDAVIRFWVTMQVENVVITFLSENPDEALPVSGEIVIRYDLYDIGINPNITTPFGC